MIFQIKGKNFKCLYNFSNINNKLKQKKSWSWKSWRIGKKDIYKKKVTIKEFINLETFLLRKKMDTENINYEKNLPCR